MAKNSRLNVRKTNRITRLRYFLPKLIHWIFSGNASRWVWGNLEKGKARVVNRVTKAGNHKVTCLLCGWKGAEFYPAVSPTVYRPHRCCPGCGSLERHRDLAGLLERRQMIRENAMVLDIGSNIGMRSYMQRRKVSYRTIDLGILPSDGRMDVKALALRDRTLDLIICFHVLEYVDDWKIAVDEFFRVLKSGGLLILCENFRMAQMTSERRNPEQLITGEPIYVFGRDFQEELAKAGFSVEPYDFLGRYDEGSDWVFICEKKASSDALR